MIFLHLYWSFELLIKRRTKVYYVVLHHPTLLYSTELLQFFNLPWKIIPNVCFSFSLCLFYNINIDISNLPSEHYTQFVSDLSMIPLTLLLSIRHWLVGSSVGVCVCVPGGRGLQTDSAPPRHHSSPPSGSWQQYLARLHCTRLSAQPSPPIGQ